jgi:hypothetical protein
MYILMHFRQKSVRYATLLTHPPPPLPLSFTTITDYPRVGEVPPGGGPQSGACQSEFNSFFGPGLLITGPQALHLSGRVPETGGLYSGVTHHTRYGTFFMDQDLLI